MAKKMSVEDLYRLFKAVSTAKLVRTDREPAQVLPGLYLGSIGAAFSLDVLKEHGITHVLCVASGIAPRFPEEFEYKVVEVLDSPEVKLNDYFEECFEFIEAGRRAGAVLVHCFAGKSRSATIVTGFVMKTRQLPFEAALELVRRTRPVAEPNLGFAAQLRSYDTALRIARGFSVLPEVDDVGSAAVAAPEDEAQVEAEGCAVAVADGSSA